MKTRPEFFTWPLERQERWRLAMPDEDRTCFEEALLAELFGRVYATRAEATAAADRLPLDEQNLWNEVVLPLHGIGEDCFFLNETFADEETLLDFETVRDYDENSYRFQEEMRKQEEPGYSVKPYRGSLYLNWARLFVDGRFAYATLSMAAGRLCAELENTACELIEQRIPHRYAPGPNHGKVEGESWEWDLRLDANGEEGILEELRRRVWAYEFDRWEALLTEYDGSPVSGAYLLDESQDDETNLHFVFTDKHALSAVRFCSFLRDRVAAIGGSWGFIIGFCLALVAWMALNTVLLMNRGFDPYPYILLNLALSTLAAIQAPIILMSQNRAAARDRLVAAHDYEVNLKAEIEIAALHEKLDSIRAQELAALIRKVEADAREAGARG